MSGDPENKPFTDFKSLVSLWWAGYKCATLSYVGLKTQEGPQLYVGRVVLEPTSVGVNESEFTFETDHILAGRSVIPISEDGIEFILSDARKGQFQVSNQHGSIMLTLGGDISGYFSPIYHPYVMEGPRLPALQFRGRRSHDLVVDVSNPREIDWELKAAEKPFDNLNELLNVCGLPSEGRMGDSTFLDIVARSPLTVSNESTIESGEADIYCQLSSGLDRDKVRLGYKIVGNNILDRQSVTGSGLEWEKKDDIEVGKLNVPVGEALLVQAFVSYAGVSLHQGWIIGKQKLLNVRNAIHQTFDSDLKLLARWILQPETDKDKAASFENGVAMLLNMLGFSVSSYGHIPKLQKGPDVIAVCPSGSVAVVECTVGLLDNKDKLSKLVQRSKLIREKLDKSGYGHLKLQPVIVTPLSRDEVAADMDKAGSHNVAVLSRENLEDLLQQSALPANADDLFETAKNFVPNVNNTLPLDFDE